MCYLREQRVQRMLVRMCICVYVAYIGLDNNQQMKVSKLHLDNVPTRLVTFHAFLVACHSVYLVFVIFYCLYVMVVKLSLSDRPKEWKLMHRLICRREYMRREERMGHLVVDGAEFALWQLIYLETELPQKPYTTLVSLRDKLFTYYSSVWVLGLPTIDSMTML